MKDFNKDAKETEERRRSWRRQEDRIRAEQMWRDKFGTNERNAKISGFGLGFAVGVALSCSGFIVYIALRTFL